MTISRRNLLKLTAASVAIPAFLPVAFGENAPNSRLRVGAVGVGGRGTYDAGLHAQHAEMVAIADLIKPTRPPRISRSARAKPRN